MSYYNKGYKYAVDKLSYYNPDLIMFLGGLINDYNDNIKISKLSQNYVESKLFTINFINFNSINVSLF